MELHKTRNNLKATQPASPSHSPSRRVRPEELLAEIHCPDTQYLSAVQSSSVWPPNRPRTPCELQDYSHGLCLVGTKTRQLRGSSSASRPPGNAPSMCNGARIQIPKRASVFFEVGSHGIGEDPPCLCKATSTSRLYSVEVKARVETGDIVCPRASTDFAPTQDVLQDTRPETRWLASEIPRHISYPPGKRVSCGFGFRACS